MPDISILFHADDERLFTKAGEKQDGRIVVRGVDNGCALFGPYVPLSRGRYLARVRFDPNEATDGEVLLEACTKGGREVAASARLSLEGLASPEISLPFELARSALRLEIRLHCMSATTAAIAGLEIVYLDRDTSGVETLLASGLTHGLSEAAIFARFDALEQLVRGGQGVYVGANRILTRLNLGEVNLAYLMPADDRLLTPAAWAYGQFEPETTRYLVDAVRKTDNCLDVGANFGYFTCLMGHLARRGVTLGVEPDPEIFELLRDNVHANSLGHHTFPILGAVSDRAGAMTLYRRDTRSGNTSIARVPDDFTRDIGEAPAAPFEASAFAVDDLLPRFSGRIDFMKVDVEGAEPLVFRGMRETLAANPRIRIVMEWSPAQVQAAGFDVADFTAELADLGLQAAVIQRDMPGPAPVDQLPRDAYFSGVLLTRTAANP